MSQTIIPGLFSAGDWTYVAAEMAAALKARADRPTDEHASIPLGVYKAAQSFFRTVIEAITPGKIPREPVTSASNFCIASRAIEMTVTPLPKSTAEVEPIIRRYSDVVNALGSPQVTSRFETSTLLDVAKFFEQIVRDGNTEAYELFVGMPEPE